MPLWVVVGLFRPVHIHVTEALQRRPSTDGGRQCTPYVGLLQHQLPLPCPQAAEYAVSRRVVLKGDLPIGVDKRSVDCWVAPHLFRTDKSTGAPPDAFSPTGRGHRLRQVVKQTR